MTIIELESTFSTNTYAAMLNPQPSMPYIVRSAFQEKGRGQGDHGWESDPGKNLLFSVVFEPKHIPIAKNFFVSKFIALSLLELVQKYEASASIKWPNDILVKEKKIAGILIENTIYGNSFKRCIAGIGLNINQRMAEKKYNAVSLKDLTGEDYDISKLCKEYIEIFITKISMLTEEGLSGLNKEYFKHLFKYNQPGFFKNEKGKFEARICDVQDDGQMVLKMPTGKLERYCFGEIEYLFPK